MTVREGEARRALEGAVPAAGAAPPLTWTTKLLYASGAAASVIKQRTLQTFVLLFYNQVVGLPPALVSLALMIAMIFDAIVDPLVGHMSDNLRHRWGRRHPFMYAAAVPVALAFFLIWNPPLGWSQWAIFAYLLACLLTIRLFDTFFELPSLALLPELTIRYNERTTLVMLRQTLGAVGGLGAVIAVYRYFMRENPEGTGGVLERAGYLDFSIFFAIVIFVLIVISSLATHSRVPYLRTAPTGAGAHPIRSILETTKNHAFLVMLGAGMCLSLGQGVRTGLELYMQLYFWQLSQAQLAALESISLVGYFCGAVIGPVLSRFLGKKHAAFITYVVLCFTIVTPVALRLLHLMPANGEDALFIFLMVNNLIRDGFGVASVILMSSMLMDVVEDVEVRTHKRSEGVILAADQLFRKLVTGFGAFIAGLVLAVVHFPQGADRNQVDPEVLRNMGLAYVPAVLLFFAGALVFLALYRINEAKHNENLETLSARAPALNPKEAS